MILKIWKYLSNKRKKQTIILGVLISIASISEMLSVGAVIPFINIISAKDFDQKYQNLIFLNKIFPNTSNIFLYVTIGFLLSIALSSLFRIVVLYVSSKLSYSIGSDFGIRIYKNALNRDYSVFLNSNTSELISTASHKTNVVIGQVLNPLFSMVSSLVMIISIISILLYINFKVTFLIFTLFSFIYIVVIITTKKILSKNSIIVSKCTTAAIKCLQEGMGGFRDVLLNGSQKYYLKIFEASDRDLRKAQSSILFISGLPKFIIEPFAIIILVLVAYNIENTLSSSSDNSLALLGAIAIGSQKLLPLFQQLYSAWSNIRGGSKGLCDVLEVLEGDNPEKSNVNQRNISLFADEILLSNVIFSYPGSDIRVLDDVNFSIKKGDRIGIRGLTGAGKSTLIDVITGLQKPCFGKISIDGMDLNEVFHDWIKLISVVSQSIYLIDDSILANISPATPINSIDLNKALSCLQRAHLSLEVGTFPHGIHTIVGERGVKLSGGQRQRIAIARALYKNSKVIIFDEGTSALDMLTEKNIMDDIYNLDSDITLILVAHRLETLERCKYIYELRDGKIECI